MSYTELQTGKIRKIGEMTFEDAEEICKNLCRDISPKRYNEIIKNGFKSYEHSWMEVVNDEMYDGKSFLLYKNGILYMVHDVKNYEDEGFFFRKEKINDTEYSFVTQYYNGGTCLPEIIEEEVDKI